MVWTLRACRGLDSMQTSRRNSALLKTFNLKEMINCLEDLINYFAYPADDLGECQSGRDHAGKHQVGLEDVGHSLTL